MATVLPNQVMQQPENQLGGIFKGLTSVLNTVIDRQQTRQDDEKLTTLQKTLEGVTDPRKRLQEIMNVAPGLKTKKSQALAIEMGKITGGGLPSAGTAQKIAATITPKDGPKRDISLTKDQITELQAKGVDVKIGKERTASKLRELDLILDHLKIDPKNLKPGDSKKALDELSARRRSDLMQMFMKMQGGGVGGGGGLGLGGGAGAGTEPGPLSGLEKAIKDFHK